MVMEREEGQTADAVASLLAIQFEPGSLLEATPECLVVAHADEVASCSRTIVWNSSPDWTAPIWWVSRRKLLRSPPTSSSWSPGTRLETICRTNDLSEIPVEIHLGTIEGPERLLVLSLRDVSILKAGCEAQFEAEAKYRALVEQIPAVVYLDPVDENSDSIYVSPQVVTLLGIDQDEWLTDPYCWRRHVHPEDLDRAWEEYEDAYNNHTTLIHEYRMVHEDGSIRWVLEQAYPINDEHGNPWLIQGVIFDISARKAAEEQVAFLAYHDKLTGLPNRALFEEMLESAITRARRHDLGVGFLSLDLDNFKLVNDLLGHHAGDVLLAQLGNA